MKIKEVVIASTNKGKIKEFQEMFQSFGIRVRTLEEFGEIPDIEEDGESFEENAKKKAETICDQLQLPTIADDSGLMVDALGGQPGIYSARFAGEEKNDQKNIHKLLNMMTSIDMEKRTAQFVSVIAFAIPGEETIIVRGTCKGMIGYEPKGEHGFGYDPIFYLPQYKMTMAEIDPTLKNQISHRAHAIRKLKNKIEYVDLKS